MGALLEYGALLALVAAALLLLAGWLQRRGARLGSSGPAQADLAVEARLAAADERAAAARP